MRHVHAPSLNAKKLANARLPEIEALYSIIKQRIRSKRKRHENEEEDEEVYVPRNERRRTTCYVNRKANLWKKRKRDAQKRSTRFKIRDSEINEDEDGANKVKKLSRRVRRRIELKGGSGGGYGCSKDGTMRLATHVWYAKRFTMSKKWGYYLPLGLHGKGKGSRAVLKWSKSGALLHDASYFSAIQLEGPEDSLVKVLRKVLEPSPPSVDLISDISRDELCGLCYGTAMLHKVGELPYGSIAPITYLWRPSFSDASSATVKKDLADDNAVKKMEVDNETRCLWIWIHAAAFNDAFNVLSSACQRQNDEDGSQLVCFSRKHDLGRLDVLGSRALELLQKILHPISRVHKNAERLKVEGSFKDFQLSESYLLANADKLLHNAVLSIEVHDPRDTPAMRNKYRPKVTSVARDDQIQQAHAMVSHKVESDVLNELPDSELILKSENENFVNMPDQTFTFAESKEEDAKQALTTLSKHLYNKTLWSSQSEGLFTGPLRENLISNRRHQERLVFFGIEEGDSQNETFEIDQGGFSSSCPIILLKNDNSKPSACGWSIILPVSWIKAFWIPLTLGRARAIGLRERRWLSCDSGLPSFPYDFPDCKAYWDHMNEEAAVYEEMIAARPPSKRPPSIFLPSQWNCIQRSVQRVCSVDLSASYITEAGGSKTGSGNVLKFGVEACLQNKSETSEAMRKEESVSNNISLIQQTNSCFPGVVARTSNILKQHLRQVGGLHLLLFPELQRVEKKTYIHLMDKGQICWSLKGVNNIIMERDPLFLRVLIYAPGKGLFEDGAVVCAPKETDFELWCSRSQGWQGLEIPPNLRNVDCIQHWMDNNETMQIANTAQRPGIENLRMPVGFVTTGACCGSVPALAVAMCEATILGQLRAEQWKDSRWRKKSQIFVLVRNMKSTVYRPALASIVIEELEDKNYQ